MQLIFLPNQPKWAAHFEKCKQWFEYQKQIVSLEASGGQKYFYLFSKQL
jgi:hypothetical protein